MKFNVNAKEFMKAVKTVTVIKPTRNPDIITSVVKISAYGNVRLTYTNTIETIFQEIENAEAEFPMSVYIPMENLVKLPFKDGMLDVERLKARAEEADAREAIATLRARGLVGADGPWAYDDAPAARLSVVRGGDVFDLGGLTVEAVRLPGHTAGSLGYLVRERRMLLSGDAVTPVMCLYAPESLAVSAYRATLARMSALPFDEFWTGHHAEGFAREELMGSFDACAAFAEGDAGHPWQSSTIAGEVGTLHIFSGSDPESPDFRAIITRRESAPRLRRRRRRGA